MAEITLKRAVKLRSDLEKKITELQAERGRIETVIIEKDEQPETLVRNVDEVVADIEAMQNHVEEVKDLIRGANVITKVTWDGQEFSLYRALDHAKTMRFNAEDYKRLGKRKKRERQGSRGFGGGDTTLFVFAQYDTEGYRRLGEKLEREADRLSDLIDEKNLSTKIQVPFAEQYM